MPVDFEKFMTQLRDPQAAELCQKIQTFLYRFRSEQSSVYVKRQQISQFLADIYADPHNHLAFLESPSSTLDTENFQEGLEKLITTKLFDDLFGTFFKDERQMNATLATQIKNYCWIEERHLDISFSYSLGLEVVQAELLRINGFKAPRDKLIVLQNVIHLITDLIQKRSGEIGNADILLPTLILVIIRANPPNLVSNVKYISRYRSASELEKGSNQFCITNMMSAISFIYELKPERLTLNEEEKRHLQEGRGPFGNKEDFKEEFKEFTENVTGFFGKVFKEVKSTAGEMIQTVTPRESKSLFTPDNGQFPRSPSNQTGLSQQEMRAQEMKRLAEREKYEMELAIAMSLSEAQEKKENLLEEEAYAPIDSLGEVEQELVRAEK